MYENCPDLLGTPRNSRESFIEIQSIDSNDSVNLNHIKFPTENCLAEVSLVFRVTITTKQTESSNRIGNLLNFGCLPFVRINRLGRSLNNGKGFSKISKPTERNGAYHFALRFPVIVFG